ncbi:hypothetical protein RHMOL_Rhmol01G0107200 [Rhododendron molle]|uniref:Uncharacterized protein n=1 Tax=Rhododendron molle TaxID=49168 RepID=A0ACC0Q1G9_RHOML|nr:hypothetical protein RHMOL_Rhmol01G0107200 [Rhododendron molle]
MHPFKYETISPVRVKSGQGSIPPLGAVDLANQQLRFAEYFLVQNDVVLARQISTVDLRDQRLRGMGQAFARISLGQGIVGACLSTHSIDTKARKTLHLPRKILSQAQLFGTWRLQSHLHRTIS